MSIEEQSNTTHSLAQHFKAPTEFTGNFGWLCGYSADAAFLDTAAEHFTGLSQPRRAYTGRVALALMLDAGHEQITPAEVPGVLHLPALKNDLPFKLLHAKVAILGFKHQTKPHQWQLRLIVSTGNWTRETLENSLDLVWRIDISSEELSAPGVVQRCVDMQAAWGMLSWLRSFFQQNALYAIPDGRSDTESGHAAALFEQWLDLVKKKIGRSPPPPRYFDNRYSALLAQFTKMIINQGDATPRNYLAFGSGFYEGAVAIGAIPSVLKKINKALNDEELLATKTEIDVFVNPLSCQAVASALHALTSAGWSVRAAATPKHLGDFQRSLHAKFIFGCNWRQNSNKCIRPWLYLGSGNLTGPGFANKMSSNGGNLEAGVVFTPQGLLWESLPGAAPEAVVSNLLPVQWDTDSSQIGVEFNTGADMLEHQAQFTAAPIAWMSWHMVENQGWLSSPDSEERDFDLLDESDNVCQRDALGDFPWNGPQPREVRLRWSTPEGPCHAVVPVLDEFGRIAATTLPAIDVDDAWGQLARFPMPPEEEDIPSDDDSAAPTGPVVKRNSQMPAAAQYPIRQMMQLIENIAEKQTALNQADWPAWCNRLEQCLTQAAGNDVLLGFIELKLNPLSPLWHAPFRPDFAATASSNEGQMYEATLKRIEAVWNTTKLGNIGVHA
jgi:hypothetical protein